MSNRCPNHPSAKRHKFWGGFASLALALVGSTTPAAKAAEIVAAPPAARTVQALAMFPEGAVLVAFDRAAGNSLWLATTVAQARNDFSARLATPELYAAAVPSWSATETIKTQLRGAFVDKQVNWELEIPLWNLKGQLWLKPFTGAVQVRLTDGAFSPGAFLWRWSQPRNGAATTITLQGAANTRDTNWGTRLIAKRSPLAEPAMTAAAAYTLLAGGAAVISGSSGHPNRWPQAPMQAGAIASYAKQLGEARGLLKIEGPLALVVRRQDGRLDHVEVLGRLGRPPASLIAALAQPQRWRSLPGWKTIGSSTPSPQDPAAGAGYAQRWVVDATFPFLDFDATWEVTVTTSLYAVASAGEATGATWSWRVFSDGGTGSVAVFSLYPRIERLGFVPRRFIEKEPLLESGLALALGYVNATSLLTAIGDGP